MSFQVHITDTQIRPSVTALCPRWKDTKHVVYIEIHIRERRIHVASDVGKIVPPVSQSRLLRKHKSSALVYALLAGAVSWV